MNKSKYFLSNLTLCVLVSILTFLSPQIAEGQTEIDLKIRLMSEALQARDSGDLTTARDRLQQLLEIAPADRSVQSILDSVDSMIDNKTRSGVAGNGAARRSALQSEAEYLARLEAERIEKSMVSSREIREIALRQAKRGDFPLALRTIRKAAEMLEPNPLTQTLIDELKRDERDILRQQSSYDAKRVAASESGKARLSIEQISPDFVNLQEEVEALSLRGRSQFVAGDIDGAEATFKRIEALDPNNAMAKSFQVRISQERQSMAYLNKLKSREQLLEEVSSAWQRPGIYEERPDIDPTILGPAPMLQKLNQIVISNVNFTEQPLNRVVNTLSAISEEFDNTDTGARGVNLVLLDPNRTNPMVNITLRNLSLKRILDFIVDSVGFQYEIQDDAVVLRPGGERRNLNTEVFPVSRSTVIRMTGISGSTSESSFNGDPFASSQGTSSPARGMAGDAVTIRNFLQQAGVDFTGSEGSTLAYDGSAMIVTQTTRNLERIRNILNRYNDVKQVEIEAKFLEVQEGTLEELGFDWIATDSNYNTGNGRGEQYRSSIRSLSDTSSPSNVASAILIDGVEVERISPPDIPGGVPLGLGSVPFTNVLGSVGSMDMDVRIRALSQSSGSDLLSAPKVTVLSGNQAEINVSQEFRYPTRYTDAESNVGNTSGGTLGGGAAGVTITPGTPEDFEMRNIGVELSVTPIVEEDDYSITLELNPKVTEFEGFVEYGGPSVALTSDRTVKVPSGFYQPIFAVREVSTKVTIWDGATVVMGGLTREDVVTVNDKVPFLGDIPFLGRFFRSEGESSSKRNLLIFVTANLVSPGGSLKRQTLRGVQPGALFQNPTIVTPGGSESRSQ
ncbi:MAG: type II secretory pathway, component PulD [Opitutales bacterium]|jgi:general secretion pathway protein D|nr:type II secretory pathway, component PulD [Opitutales bacterium]MBT5170021.1 type II secretory pathway, component PulD [Opitutales bacterium]MBT5814636.1 type II secretory pathway, component PulD [Opitutales bacterium]MDG2253443.1 type II secretory pathway, component PulD [Opitutaceae bacterium]